MPDHQESRSWHEALTRIEEARRSNSSSLDLGGIKLTAIPDSLAQLVNLRSLFLGENQVTTIPDSLARLTSLQNLDLSNNQITAIPDTLVELANLRHLHLDNNQITTIPNFLAELANLQHLDLGDNQITIIPTSFDRCANLQVLKLHNNQITAIPESLAQLTSLQYLSLSNNQITSIPDSIAQFANLEYLYLDNNHVTAIPDSLAQGVDLLGLFLNNNRITAIPDALAKLTNLQNLGLSNNQITSIPSSLGQLANLGSLDLDGNPLPEELLAALKRGVPSFFRYLRSTTSSKVYPRSVKLVLLGESQSGKTTLLEALKGNPQPCDDKRKETIGVDVINIEQPHPVDHRPMSLSVWDFAGQHIEHATHQFFLSENAIYLLLWNARQGTEYGKRDLWYWLELLKMRVREPNFLLVATHTEHTPPDLNLSEIEHLYAGCQGHFPVELCSSKGLKDLQTKILELAANSPSMRAPWPVEWLPVRDEVRKIRHRRPYMTPADFRSLMKKKGVTGREMQKDLAGQLHELGEILYFQGQDELSGLVILNPKWVTELIALVVRSEEVRQQNGILRKADLDKLWARAKLEPKVREHLIHLMDSFDLTYSTEHRTDLGIVVEALPYSTPDSLKQFDPAAGQPQMEMIFRFPSLQRRLPPGIPTWGIARAHRFLKCRPWRNAAVFEDRDTNSQALILASDITKEIRLRVAADYPPFFFGRIEAILRDTFKRYRMEPDCRLPCACQPECSHSYKYEIVLKRWRDGNQYVVCGDSGKDVAVESLLSGARRPDTTEGFLALQSEMRRIATEQLRTQRERMEKNCPSVFTLVPSRDFKQLDTWFESVTQGEELELALYCEHDSGWHATSHSLYRFRPDQEWFDSLKERWNQLVGASKYVGPLAKAVGKASKLIWVEAGGMAIEKLPEASRSKTGTLSQMVGRKAQPEFIDTETRYLLERLINYLDSQRPATEPKNGGLHRYLIDDGRLLWLCPDHLKLYRSRP